MNHALALLATAATALRSQAIAARDAPHVCMPEVLWACARPGDVDDDEWDALAALLDSQERARAWSFRIAADRSAYVLAHALRRALLAQELGVSPEALRFSHDPAGCPHLVEPAEAAVFFSHSHSRKLVACAVTPVGPVGLDVEPIDGAQADWGLLRPFLSEPTGDQHDDEERPFFLHWTAMEAFWKARGSGLANTSPIRLAPRLGQWTEVRFRGQPAQTAGHVMCIDAFDDCALAIALLSAPAQTRCVRAAALPWNSMK